MTWRRLGVLLAICTVLGGCVTGQKFSDAAHGRISQIPNGDGRVYFYRTQLVFGMAVQPAIDLNGQPVASCAPNGVAIADVPPGNYEASVKTEVEHKIDFTIAAGEQKYILCSIGFGWLIGRGDLDLVDPAQGRADIQGLAYTGKTLVAAQ
jgi:Protein of unknown function (DUF2846)